MNHHDYLSTACYHGRHQNCRLTCKFCVAPCKCVCHTPREEKGTLRDTVVDQGG